MQNTAELDAPLRAVGSLKSKELPLVRLMAAFALIDGELSNRELDVIRSVCVEFDIDFDLCRTQLDVLVGEDCSLICELELDHFVTENERELVLTILFEIADADDVFHLSEKLFLDAVRRRWGAAVTFGRGILKWNHEQKSVIESPSDDWLFVNAGPGTGKTAVACAKVVRLIDNNISPANIWLISFTRTAVKEITDRISALSEAPESILGVKIATIDSRAWNMRYGIGVNDANALFGGFETNIVEATALLRQKRDQFDEYFSSLEHILIDEAQDITSPRIEFLLEILSLLPPNCGVTVFGDPAQAIYGFTGENESAQRGSKKTFIAAMLERYPDKFREVALKIIHRTDSPNLIRLIEGLRLDVIVDEGVDSKKYREVEERIRQSAKEAGRFDAKNFRESENSLVLFRTRAEVLQASSYASQNGIKHRIRMGGTPNCIKPWISQLFYDFHETHITRQAFEARWAAREYFLTSCNDTSSSAWELLSKITDSELRISIAALRSALSRSTPDVSVCLPELGVTGPIIGTIHGSKGREAEDVHLFLRSSCARDTDFAEESRVLFVGASRARKSLSVGEGHSGLFASTLSGGRVYRRIFRTNKVQVQIGEDHDVDVLSPVAVNRSTETEAIELQRILSTISADFPLKGTAIQQSRELGYVYDVMIPSKEGAFTRVGSLTQRVNSDLFRIRQNIGRYGRPRIQDFLPHLNIIGLRSVVRAEGHPDLNQVHPTFRRSGFWIAPILLGFPTLYFN